MDIHLGRSIVRLLTLNLWAKHGDWAARRRVLTDGGGRIRPDLVAFQEAIVDDTEDQVRDILGDGYHVAHQRTGLIGDGRHRGVSVASRWPVREVREADLHVTPRTGDYACGTVAAEVAAPVGPVLLVAHLGERARPEPGPTFDPANPLTALDEPGLDRARRIDYVLVRCGRHGPTLRVVGCHRVFTEPVDGVWASDHFGVVAELAVP